MIQRLFEDIPKEIPCYIYLIRCKNNALYCGVTIDFIRRWKEHFNGTGARYIANNGFDKPVFLQKFKNKSKAMREERFIKKQQKLYKEELINSDLNLFKKSPNFIENTWIRLGYREEMPWDI